MPCIYKITNQINQKVYVGKTIKTAEIRWKEHCNDYNKRCNEKRPLYSAMKKYGLDNFSIETIEQCDISELSEREIYWIKYYNSYKCGYNATKGGDGKFYVDYDLIVKLHNDGLNIKNISQQTGYSLDTCSIALKIHNVSKEDIQENANLYKSKCIAMVDKNTHEILAIYKSITEAYKNLGKEFSGHIADVCNNKRKTAYGYSWKYM